MNGQLHHGHHFLAGEIGLMCMGPQYVDTDFGSRGCLETLSGAGSAAGEWHPEGADCADGLRSCFAPPRTATTSARETVDDAATLLGIAAANVCSVLDPSLVVLGGALAVQARAARRARASDHRQVHLPGAARSSRPALDKDAPLWGSLLLATSAARERLRERFGNSSGRIETQRLAAAARSIIWFAFTFCSADVVPSGHVTSSDSAAAALPSPKCSRLSSCEM